MGNKARDIALIGVLALLALFTLWPSGADRDGEGEREPEDQGAEDPVDDQMAAVDGGASGDSQSGRAPAAGPGSSDAVMADLGPHELFPAAAGNRWVYRAKGHPRLTPADSWTMEIVSAPDSETGAPGVVRAGFGELRKDWSIWIVDGELRTDALPLTEPLEFLGDKPRGVSGALLPQLEKINIGAVWINEYKRVVEHIMDTPRKGRSRVTATGTQSDRATVEELEEVIVPAGRFEAFRIAWLGRLDLYAGKRQVLFRPTADPFRSETTWFAPGVGMVKRSIVFDESARDSVTFVLTSYQVGAAR